MGILEVFSHFLKKSFWYETMKYALQAHCGYFRECIRLSTAWQDDPPPELLEGDRLPQNEVWLPLS